ncbi:hypothetical protein L2E82_20283 [Cichorium intybus]|uniref:Uncharacterized protein n=1 Tax=Cichorium intybus TaxID=13427 RepID=A0ACB9DTP4_CICIN|nr:hypothetical protein L2E82_20283 [Cichorium intybus]
MGAHGQENEGEWKTVDRRRARRLIDDRNLQEDIKKIATTFFVPENVELPVVQSVEKSSEGVDLAKQSAKKVSREHEIKDACTRDLHSKNDEFQDVQEPRKGIACARDLHSNNYEFQVVQEPMKGIAYACENINTPSQDGGSGTSMHYWANDGGPRSEGGIEDSGPNGFLEVSNGGDNFSPYISRNYVNASTPNEEISELPDLNNTMSEELRKCDKVNLIALKGKKFNSIRFKAM